MSKKNGNETGIVNSVGQIGLSHEAAYQRSYWNQPELYTQAKRLEEDWHHFRQESLARERRRAMMRTLVTTEVLGQVQLPMEAVIPYRDINILYLGQNVHRHISQPGEVRLPPTTTNRPQLLNGYRLDYQAHPEDAPQLTALWEQFGWTREGVETFIEMGTTPLTLIRNQECQVVAAMIAESLEFGEILLVELTEMAVAPTERGNGLAAIIIRELSQLSIAEFGTQALLYGEYNLTTRAHRSSARAGNQPACAGEVTGILTDHVTIETGRGNPILEPWDTQWLHDFLVMYYPQR